MLGTFLPMTSTQRPLHYGKVHEANGHHADADTRGAGRAAADAWQAKTGAQESEGVKMDCANNSVLGDNSGGIGLAPDVVECRLNQIMEPSAIERPHKSEGILCRSTKLPLTLLEGIIFKGNQHQTTVNESTTLERALDEG